MIGDSIDYLEDKTGKRAEGICYAMQTLISKIGMAFTAFVTLLVLGTAGYAAVQAGASAGDVISPDELNSVQSAIWAVTTLACGISMAACAIPLFFYTFNEKEQAEAVARVAARKAAARGETEFVESTVTVDEQNEAKGFEASASEMIGDIISEEPSSTDDTKKE